MDLKQAFEILHDIDYKSSKFDNLAVISEPTRNSLIKVFKDNKAEFTNKLKISKSLLKNCIISQFNKDYYK